MTEIKIIKSFCQSGNHWYERESRRGRPPLNCPEHTIEKPTVVITRPVNKIKTSIDLVPGLAEALEQEKMEELYCEAGNHNWSRISKRGAKPKSCPEHSVQGEIIRKVVKGQINREKSREELTSAVAALSARVALATGVDDAAYLTYRANPADEKLFKQWMRVNSRLLGEVTAFRAQQNKLERLEM